MFVPGSGIVGYMYKNLVKDSCTSLLELKTYSRFCFIFVRSRCLDFIWYHYILIHVSTTSRWEKWWTRREQTHSKPMNWQGTSKSNKNSQWIDPFMLVRCWSFEWLSLTIPAIEQTKRAVNPITNNINGVSCYTYAVHKRP